MTQARTHLWRQSLDIFDIEGKDVVKDFSPSEDVININEELHGTNILAIDTDKGTILTSDTGLEALIKKQVRLLFKHILNFID